jgi:photosystem II stability/assembly factor-like uncharacterized protein
MTRRRSLLLAAAAPLVGAPLRAAPYQADGPARLRPLAARGVLLDLALAGRRLVAVGERGHVLLSDDAGKAWRQARSVPTRTLLTAVHATSERQLWACGHGGVIVGSSDAGETWTLADGRADGPDVLLAIRVQPDGQGLAVGGFGAARSTADGGRSWKPVTLIDGEAGERHLNRILLSAGGSWLIPAEGGHVLRGSGSAGALRWQAVKTPYAGSLWCGLQLGNGVLVVGGMRGNLVRSADDGRSWQHQAVPEAGSFTAGLALPDDRPLLVGVDGTVVRGDATASSFRLHRLDDRVTLTAVARLPDARLVATSLAGARPLDLPG